MRIDLTLPMTKEMLGEAKALENKSLAGHLGTHFDVMNKEFPLDYTERRGILFDVRHVTDRDIDIGDIDLDAVEKDMFVAFYTGYIEREPYGTAVYYREHPQLSDALIEALLDKEISIIALDCAGIRRGKEHTPKDQHCAERGVFVVENLCNLQKVLEQGPHFTALTCPMPWEGLTGLPCRVIAKL
ncbi:MAG: cyclase family protein [Clostridia bacterium]|nr:cyclase family protein [Clostridia bacterium]